jgi:predicted MFS family arabinose efflux permease
VLLTTGFFVCGFHVAFITVHFPAYVKDLGLGAQVGAYAIALIGLCNIAGSFLSGALGQRWSKKGGLAFIYFARAICITALLLAPKTELTIYGVWLGGRLYDTMGSYDPVWWAGVVLGVLAAVIHLPINEKPLARLAPLQVKA